MPTPSEYFLGACTVRLRDTAVSRIRFGLDDGFRPGAGSSEGTKRTVEGLPKTVCGLPDFRY